MEIKVDVELVKGHRDNIALRNKIEEMGGLMARWERVFEDGQAHVYGVRNLGNRKEVIEALGGKVITDDEFWKSRDLFDFYPGDFENEI